MGMVTLLVLTWLAIVARQSVASEDQCFGNPKYIAGCDGKTLSERPACKCVATTCYFKLVIESYGKESYGKEGNKEKPLLMTVNGLFQGPTIIVNKDAKVVVDVFNNMGKNASSIHWHGMHQENTPWMDGVSYITQWGIQPGGKFRYIFRATPSGTFWYHSHERNQREFGYFGTLIVKEPATVDLSPYGDFEDKPEQHTLVFLDFVRLDTSDYTSTSRFARNEEPRQECLPDGSKLANSQVGNSAKISINGKAVVMTEQQGREVPPIDSASLEKFYVKPGKTYRFRMIAAMEGTPYRFSIDGHTLTVIATDGYLIKPYETDYLIIHVGERFDFLLTAATGSKETQFPMRTETLAVDCISGKNLQSSGFAVLLYGSEGNVKVDLTNLFSQFHKPNPKGCSQSNVCKVLNCPFGGYRKGLHLECHHVDKLKLLHPSDENDVPDSADITYARTKFFNFNYNPWKKLATVNGKQLAMPPIALQVSDYEGKINECNYDTKCSSPDNKQCVHIVDIPERHYNQGIRFVLSTLAEVAYITFTHPMHLHGHSFHVVKFGFPDYNEDGTVKNPNKDLQPDTECDGPPHWTNNIAPDGLNTDITTVRKDTIMVPAGGYVVIDFIADNPGYWFMHCHIDHHLLHGMGVVIRELKDCQNEPPCDLQQNATDFCWDVDDYDDATSPDNVPDCAAKAGRAIQHDEDSVHFKEQQDYLFEKKINRLKKQQAIEKRGPTLPKDQADFTGSSKYRLENGAFRPLKERTARRFEERAFKPFKNYRRFREDTSAKERPMLTYWDYLLRKKGSDVHN